MKTNQMKIFHIGYLFIMLGFLTNVQAKTARYRLVFSSQPANEICLGWDQVAGNKPVVYYDTVDHSQNSAAYQFSQQPQKAWKYKGMNNHFAFLKNLKPDCVYYFVIKDSKHISRRYWFKTAPAQPDSFTFVAGGDTKSYFSQRKAGIKSNKMIARLRPLFIVFDGDFTSWSGCRQWKKWLNDWQLTVSPDGQMYPIVPVRGNHENKDEVLFKIFALKNPENFYSISIGGNQMQIYALNSETGNFNEQRKWLIKNLKQNSNVKFKIAAYHKPFFPHTASKPERVKQFTAWADVFYDHHFLLGIECDSHMHKITYPVKPRFNPPGFERDDKNGTVFIGEGSWGARPRPADDDKPWTMNSASFNQIKWLHVYPEQIRIFTIKTQNVEQVAYLTKKSIFQIPENLNIQQLPNFQNYFTLPVKVASDK